MPKSLDEAQATFRAHPVEATADDYLSALMDYWRDGMIGMDTYQLGILEVADWLRMYRRLFNLGG